MTSVTLHIEGMSCNHCLNAVRTALDSVPGTHLERVQIGRADLSLDHPDSVAALVAAVTDAGYRATPVVRQG